MLHMNALRKARSHDYDTMHDCAILAIMQERWHDRSGTLPFWELMLNLM